MDPYYDDPGVTLWYLVLPDLGALQALLLPCNPAGARASVPFIWHLDSFLLHHTNLQINLCWCPPDRDSLWVSEVRNLAKLATQWGS